DRSRVEVSLRSDPDVIADFAASVVTALQHRLRSDEHCVAELHRLGMFENDTGSHLQAVTCTTAHRAHEHTSHKSIKVALTSAKTGVNPVQLFARMLRLQRVGKLPFPCRIRPHFFAAKCRGNFPDSYCRLTAG